MMKKLLLLPALMLMISIGLVSAGNHEAQSNLPTDNPLGEIAEGNVGDIADLEKRSTNRSRVPQNLGELGRTDVPPGLERALILVDNENARAAIEGNIERFVGMNELPCRAECAVEARQLDENTTRANFREEVRVLGLIPAVAQERVTIENGAATERSMNFVRRLVELGVAR